MAYTLEKKKPSTLKYIGVWILASITAGLSMVLVDYVVFGTTMNVYELPSGNYWLISPILRNATRAAVIIAVYSMFRDLRFGSVVPWLIGLSIVGFVVSIISTYSMFAENGRSVPPTFYISTAISFGLALFAIIYFFKTKQPERY
ncbi:hypothetical protein [Paracoccus fistulariae]|uniref:Uncharacterized protein n=1 Tax=Paracoccus fistulariae TaxID=658446 RepID=A0ABY7SFN6_9RHOB|nr:hypothetical protein [Paracoccus fistulariae]MDB6181877.1 hypothetical protein [Paracoccus fistulariae]WCR05835.1 hypothetical protein JHX87_09840 [Paracoccus fistulariae]